MGKDLLKKLVMCPSPSGFEFMAHSIVSEELSGIAHRIWTDGIGNQYITLSEPVGTKPTVMLSAHLDEIGLQLAAEHDGTWKVGRLGGIDPKTLVGSIVRVYTDPSDPGLPWKPGVIGKKAIHLETPEEREKATKLKDLEVDFGGISGLSVGMPVVPDRVFTELGEDLVAAPGLDDKAGCAVVIDVLKRLAGVELPVNLVAVLCAQEETGLRGAKIAAKALNPDYSIDLDVSFAGQRGELPGEIKVGNGPIVMFGPDKDYHMSHALDSSSVPHQTEVSRAGGTNTAAIQENALDCRCALISIPEKSMHTAVEIVSMKDLEDCVLLILEYLNTFC